MSDRVAIRARAEGVTRIMSQLVMDNDVPSSAMADIIERELQAVSAEATAAERARLALAIRLVQERQAQHKAALKCWKEPDGYLVPTEPDPNERHGIRAMLAAAIVEDGYALGAMQKEEPIS